MGKHYTEEFKNKILEEYKNGKYGGHKTLAKHYGLSDSTVFNWIIKDKKQGNQLNDINHTRGRHKKDNI